MVCQGNWGHFSVKRWRFFEYQRIVNRGKVYLRRWRLIMCPWGSVYLHAFIRPDDDPDPHDHPWNFWSLILWGGYVEEISVFDDNGQRVSVQEIVRRPLSIRRTMRGDFHRVKSLLRSPTWTVIVTGPYLGTWGFFNRSLRQWVHWRDYLDEREADRAS